MTPAELKEWLGVAALLISVGGFLYAWITRDSKVNAAKLGGAEDRLDDHERRIQSLETEIRHLPDRETIADMRLVVAKLEGTVGTLNEVSTSTARAVRRVEDFLLQSKRDRP